jgi:hypothetical protein
VLAVRRKRSRPIKNFADHGTPGRDLFGNRTGTGRGGWLDTLDGDEDGDGDGAGEGFGRDGVGGLAGGRAGLDGDGEGGFAVERIEFAVEEDFDFDETDGLVFPAA